MCDTTDKPVEARKQLISKIVERIFVYDDKILALVLYGDYLGKTKQLPSK